MIAPVHILWIHEAKLVLFDTLKSKETPISPSLAAVNDQKH